MNAASKWAQDEPIVEALGCAGGATGAARLACLRALPAAVVGKAMPAPWGTPGIWGWGWNGPTLPPPAAGKGRMRISLVTTYSTFVLVL